MLHVLLTCDLWVTCARSGPKCPPLQPFGKHPLRWQVTAVPLVWCTRHSAAVKLIWNLTIVVFEWFGVELLWNCGTSQCEHLASRHHKASRDTVWYSTVHQSDDTTGTEWLNWGRWLGDYFFFAGWIMMDLLFLLETYTNLFKHSCLEVNLMLCLGDPIACCLSIASVSYWIYLIYVNLCYLDLSRDT